MKRVSAAIFAALLIGLIGLIGLLAGCNVIGFAMNAAAGDNPKLALYKLPKKPTVVLVEKYDNPAVATYDAEPLARYVTDEMIQNGVAPMIDPARLSAVQDANGDRWRTMTIREIGLAAQADQVLYVSIARADVGIDPGGDMIHGEGEVRVRVVETANGSTLWPTDEAAGFLVSASTKLRRRDEEGHTELTTHGELMQLLGAKVGQLFISKTDEPTPRR